MMPRPPFQPALSFPLFAPTNPRSKSLTGSPPPLPLPGQIMSTAQEIKPTYANDDPSSLPLLIFARRKCSNDVPWPSESIVQPSSGEVARKRGV